MPGEPVFKRVLVKISGEALKGRSDHQGSIDQQALSSIAQQVCKVVKNNIEVALVVGAGNFFRGLTGTKKGIRRTTGDYMGMLGTVMNALALRDGLESVGVGSMVYSALPVEGIAESVDIRKARHLMNDRKVVIFAGGTGHPFFTTDTTAALRACEIEADAVLKATKVDGVYSADPIKYPGAQRYDVLSFAEALQKRLGVMDSTAFSLCMDNGIKIVVFNFWEVDGLLRVIQGDTSIATIVGTSNRKEY